MGLLTEVQVPFHPSHQSYIRGVRSFKVRNNVACDLSFKQSISNEMVAWKEIKSSGLDILTWWELVVKPGIRNIAITRDKEIKQERRGQLNMLYIRQAYLVKKLQLNNLVSLLSDLHLTQALICEWLEVQSKQNEFAASDELVWGLGGE